MGEVSSEYHTLFEDGPELSLTFYCAWCHPKTFSYL